MTTENATRRRARAVALVLLAAGLSGVAAVTLAIEARSSRPDAAAGPVLPGLQAAIGNAQRISVTSADASYKIEKTDHGWVMRDRGDYPVERGPLERFTTGLEGLQYVRRMTSDPAKQTRLGVDDPRHGGHGVLVQVEGAQGGYLVNLILGVQPNGLYVRRPDQPQIWAARGELPPFRDVSTWLDLAPLHLDATAIQRVEVQPATGGAYIIARDTPTSPGFTLQSPARAPASPEQITSVGEYMSHLAPIDVQAAPAIQGPPRARIRVTTAESIVIDGELIDRDGKTWLKLVAHSDDAARAEAVQAINNRAAGWAYALSSQDLAGLAPPLSSLLPQPAAHVEPTPAGPAPAAPTPR